MVSIVLLNQPLYAITRHALIFAIGNYPEKKNGWVTLERMRDSLMLHLESLVNNSYNLTRGFEGYTEAADCTTSSVSFTIKR